MVGAITANANLGIPCCERNGFTAFHYTQNSNILSGFSFVPCPIVGIYLNSCNAKNSGVFRAKFGPIKASSKGESDIRLSNGNLLEKDTHFKPSFDEYLKVMESVRSTRYKKQSDDSYKLKVKDDASGKRAERTNISKVDDKETKRTAVQVNLDEGNPFKVDVQRNLSNSADRTTSKIDMLGNKLQDKRKGVTGFKDEVKGKTHVGSKENDKQYEEKRKGKGLDSVEPKLRRSNINSSVAFQANVLDVKKEAERVREGSSMKTLKKIAADVNTKHGKDTLKVEKFAVRLSRNSSPGENVSGKKIGQSYRRLSRSGKALLESTKESSLEVERAAFKNLDALDDVMDKPRVSKMEMEERIQMLAQRLNGADIDMPEWMFAQMMRSAKIRYSDHSILRVIQVLGKLGNWRRVLQVIEWLQMHERFKSHKLRFIYTTALDVLGKARRPVEALNLFNAMQQQFSTYPDLVAYHSIAVTLGQAGYMRELFDVIDSMHSPPKKFKTGSLEKWDPRLQPDVVIYNAVLNACVKRENWEGAFWVLQQLKQQGLQPSTSTYGLVMEVMLACGKYNLVHEFFRKVQKSSIPNALTYKVLVNTLWKEGKIDEAVLAIQHMEKRGIVGSAALYYDFARCLCSAGRCEEALMQIEKICRVANKPLVVTYTGLIQACLDSRDIKSAVSIFNHMKAFCSPNLVTYNVLLKGYLEHGTFEEARALFQNLSEHGSSICNKSDYKDVVLPDIYTFNTMLDASFAEKRWDDFGYFYNQMFLYGYHFNPKRHLRMILEASRAGKDELLETTWKHLARADRIPPPTLVKERFCVKLAAGDYSEALSCISNLQSGDVHLFPESAWLNLLKERNFPKDSVVQLMHKISMHLTRNDPPNPVFQNLLLSCKEFCRIRITEADKNLNNLFVQTKPMHV